MRWRIDKDTRTDRGASAVEFALVVIPLLMIIAGIVNFGFAFAQQLALDNSVRAGARAGVVDRGTAAPTPLTVATDQWNSTAIARSLTDPITVVHDGGVGSTCKGSAFGGRMVVKGTVTSRFLVPWPLPSSVVPSSVTLTSKAEFQCEYQ
jgi:Flp pilus assembly protein TadG